MTKKIVFDKEVTLGQFLKSEGIISTGGQAKWYLQDNPVTLNGELENRRGKKLLQGDTLEVEGEKFTISYTTTE
ncbi:S4 domain-containing protein YaaA [Macrococcus sp. DPC7161]|uniref:S4 domain-containing protein YaaA n=1 Tax=Macrococcus sp. DPC7161 TaxID=2507060 RepID=UPI00100C120E|nr:S4 domain-containing protein YaaA [Macrococcus sp. DPC7161]RXK18544.1 S4 domain-containing protein YaaA [Macrococcus sp. DPC7161]